MTDVNLVKSKAIVRAIEAGNVTELQLRALMTYIRDDLIDETLHDIAHCIVHSTRDNAKSLSVRSITKYIDQFARVARSGGYLESKPIYQYKNVLAALVREMRRLGIEVDSSAIHMNRKHLKMMIIENLDGVAFKIDHKDVDSCEFMKRIEGKYTNLYFSIRFKTIDGPVIKIGPSTNIICPVFI